MLALGVACDFGPPEVAAPHLEVVPDSATLTHVGQRLEFKVHVSGGAEVSPGSVAWYSSDPTVFTVDSNGEVTARGNGTGNLIAALGVADDQAVVQVKQTAAFLEGFGVGQRGLVGIPLAEPVGVQVLDAGKKPIATMPVTFEVISGGGSVGVAMVLSDTLGVASTRWTLGGTPGAQTLGASATSGVRTEIMAMGLEPDSMVTHLIVHSGGGQSGSAGQALPQPVTVRVLEDAGRPVPGATVVFVPRPGNGEVQPKEVQSNHSGVASTTWTLGDTIGPQALGVMAATGVRAEIAATAVSSAGVCARAPAVRDEILRALRTADCGEVSEEDLASVRQLFLQGRNIQALHRGDFAGLANLGLLALENNELEHISSDILSGLSGLLELRLNNNRLMQLSEGTFRELANLRRLDLDGNRLARLPPDAFAGLSSLENLNLGDNWLGGFQPGTFEELSSLQRLVLWRNRITHLEEDAFIGLSGLRTLFLSRNRIGKVHPKAFSGLNRLSVLWLSHNRLSELPSGVFADLQELSRLTLQENVLTGLPEDIFAGLSRLEWLSLRYNQLTSLPPRLFAELSALESLHLHNNWRISELPPEIFNGLSSLSTLNITDFTLEELPPGIFRGLSKLTNLVMFATFNPGRNCSWHTVLPVDTFAGLSNLSALDLGGNCIPRLLPGTFDGLPKLSTLRLLSNDLTELPEGIFSGLSSLESLDLQNNPGTPFPLKVELRRSDTDDLLAPGPARVVLRVATGAPFPVHVSVSVQQGTASATRLAVQPGKTVSAPITVNDASQGTGATYVVLEPLPPGPIGYIGVEVVRGDQLILFAHSTNRAPEGYAGIPQHRLQVAGPTANIALSQHFSDPDRDSLIYQVSTSDPTIAVAKIQDATLVLEPVSTGSALVEVSAIDPAGLRATRTVGTSVASATDPNSFNIELVFGEGFTAAQQSEIRRAAQRWMEVVTGDLFDVGVLGHLTSISTRCGEDPGPRFVGTVDDLVIRMFKKDLGSRILGRASLCGVRLGSGLSYYGANWFSERFFAGEGEQYSLYATALHEIGHVLGIGLGKWYDILKLSRSDGTADPHFPGPLAIDAFDAAGGDAYVEGSKVPVEGGSTNAHWRPSAIPNDILVPTISEQRRLSAITVQALADLGYEVDPSKADPYILSAQARAALAGDRPDADKELLTDDLRQGPIVVVDRNGKIVRVIGN